MIGESAEILNCLVDIGSTPTKRQHSQLGLQGQYYRQNYLRGILVRFLISPSPG